MRDTMRHDGHDLLSDLYTEASVYKTMAEESPLGVDGRGPSTPDRIAQFIWDEFDWADVRYTDHERALLRAVIDLVVREDDRSAFDRSTDRTMRCQRCGERMVEGQDRAEISWAYVDSTGSAVIHAMCWVEGDEIA